MDSVDTICEQKEWGYLRENQFEFGGYDLHWEYKLRDLQYDSLFQANIGLFGVTIDMNRQIETYCYQYYIPCMVIVTTSFLSFVVPLTAIPGRVMIVVTQFLNLTNLFSNAMVSN